MANITVTRDNDRDLSFDGRAIGFSSSQRTGSERWFELTIFQVAGGRGYVAAGRGVSLVDGEVDRCWAFHALTADALVDGLYRTRTGDGLRYLTRTSRIALEDAAESCQALDKALVETL